MTSSPLTDRIYLGCKHDDDRMDAVLELCCNFERALREISEIAYTQTDVTYAALTSHKIATEALSKYD